MFKGELCEKQPDHTSTWRGGQGTSQELRWQGMGNHFNKPGMAEMIEVTAPEIPTLGTKLAEVGPRRKSN